MKTAREIAHEHITCFAAGRFAHRPACDRLVAALEEFRAPSPVLQPAPVATLSTNDALIRELRFDSPDLDTTLAILRGVDAFLARAAAPQLSVPAEPRVDVCRMFQPDTFSPLCFVCGSNRAAHPPAGPPAGTGGRP